MKSILDQFNKYAGREVTVTEKLQEICDFKYYETSLNEKDKTIVALKKEAAAAGFSLRTWLPGTLGTMDVNPSRLNVYIEKETDGKYRIQNNFRLG